MDMTDGSKPEKVQVGVKLRGGRGWGGGGAGAIKIQTNSFQSSCFAYQFMAVATELIYTFAHQNLKQSRSTPDITRI